MEEPKLPIPNLLKPDNGKQNKFLNLDLDIRSEEVQEIIGKPPHWLVRGGISMFFGVLALIFIAASFIQYPEIIKTQLTLAAINAPKTLESKTSGKIVRLFKENKTPVIEGEILGWMESTADHYSVLTLRSETDSLYMWLEENDYSKLESSQISTFQNLGELQTNLQLFNQVYSEYLLFFPGGYHSQRRSILEQEQDYTRALLSKLEEQKEIQKANYELANQEFEAQKKLADKGIVARLDLLKAENELSNKQLPLQQTESAIINNRMAQTAKRKEIMDLDQQIKEQKSIFGQALQTFRSAITEWESKYLLTAPVSGTLTYAGIVQEQQTYQSGREILYIQPENAEFFGEMRISQSSFGKIEEGQQVLVRFSGYPHHEFGSVIGTVDYLSEFPIGDSLFFAKVSFPEGLKTNYGQTLPPASGMKAQAEIITQDMRLLKRVYNNLTKELR